MLITLLAWATVACLLWAPFFWCCCSPPGTRHCPNCSQYYADTYYAATSAGIVAMNWDPVTSRWLGYIDVNGPTVTRTGSPPTCTQSTGPVRVWFFLICPATPTSRFQFGLYALIDRDCSGILDSTHWRFLPAGTGVGTIDTQAAYSFTSSVITPPYCAGPMSFTGTLGSTWAAGTTASATITALITGTVAFY